jgi:hypothetical protein
MKIATAKQIRDELNARPREEVMLLMQRLLRFKKENKELINYLLYYADDEQGFIDAVKQDMIDGFSVVNTSSFFLAKKSVRKVLRMMNKYIRYSAKETSKVELILFFCQLLKNMDRDYRQSRVLDNLFERQIALAEKTLLKVHEDLRTDYRSDFEQLRA